MVLGVATLDRSPDQSLGVRPISPSQQELRGTRRGGPPEWSTDQVGLGLHTLEWIFYQTCLQGAQRCMTFADCRSQIADCKLNDTKNLPINKGDVIKNITSCESEKVTWEQG